MKLLKKREILGRKKKWHYIMNMPIGEMKVMIPLDNSDQIGLREVIDRQSVKKVFPDFKRIQCPDACQLERPLPCKFDKIKSGNIFKVAEVA